MTVYKNIKVKSKFGWKNAFGSAIIKIQQLKMQLNVKIYVQKNMDIDQIIIDKLN